MEDFCFLCYIESFPSEKVTREFFQERKQEFYGDGEEVILCYVCHNKVDRWYKRHGLGAKSKKLPKKTDAHNI